MGGKQLRFSDHDQTTAKSRSNVKRLLARIQVLILLKTSFDLIEPHFTKASK